jgi:hypothetical protein
MHRLPLAGLKTSRHLVAKTVASCLGTESDLLYDWADKVRSVVLGIALARSVVLQDIARTQPGSIKTSEDRLSNFLGQERLRLEAEHRRYVIETLRRLGRRRFVRFNGKVVLLVDTTSYAKARSRGKERPMPRTGKVVLHNLPVDQKVLVTGYQELWAGLLLKDRRCLGITRKLFTENMEFFTSQHAIELSEIRRAIEIVKEAFKCQVIVVADRGFKGKELLQWLKEVEKTDFIIRIDGNINVDMRGWGGLLEDLIVHQPERLRMFWREDSKEPILSEVRAQRMWIETDSGRTELSAVCLTPIHERKIKPMYLATTLSVSDRKALSWVVRAYSARWSVETFFFQFKRSLRVAGFRVFSSWGAIENLLSMAHMAFLALYLLYLEIERDPALRAILRVRLRLYFARPPEFTVGRLMELLAMDFAQRAWAGGAP